ncbi:hypothetical protein ACFE04_027682 [Oxalis oulophora]
MKVGVYGSTSPKSPGHNVGIDVREEYANAFRTESYLDFWTRVLTLSYGNKGNPIESSTSAARLPSYWLFAEQLLEPDQSKITRILDSAQIRPKYRLLLSNYFSETANAFLVCGKLLKDAQNIRTKYRKLKNVLQPLLMSQISNKSCIPHMSTHLVEFSKSSNPFTFSSSTSPSPIWTTQFNCSELLKRLESSRDQARSKLQVLNRLKHGSAISLIVVTTSLSVIVATHGLALLVASPSLLAATIELSSTKKLANVSAQLDAAAKGTYILNRDLDTISRLVARVNGEMEDMRAMIGFWLERGEDQLRAIGEVASQLKKGESSFCEQLDELEEHLYLCFMTINRARNLVVKEILDPDQPLNCVRRKILK